MGGAGRVVRRVGDVLMRLRDGTRSAQGVDARGCGDCTEVVQGG